MATLVGAAASSALVVGAALGTYWRPPTEVVAAALAFSAGALITAVAYDLFEDAFKIGGIWLAGGGLLVGAAVFIFADAKLEAEYEEESSGWALVAAVTLDGVPENLALGVALIGSSVGQILALLAAIFASNLPEALGGAQNMKENGRSNRFAVGVWVVTGVVLAASVVVGNVVFAKFGKTPLAAVRAFAGGSVLASVADEVMPDAYEAGGPYVAFGTVAGFLTTFVLT
ncbi:ZIP family metal transporter [Halorussus aquaticus]|uniref:ZIP family metal transporter n=1 Tax=Halorussus aquaticus TaxID=2953748 RepID=A0ABD5PX67_9EURY|nr:hypothetical protein [Halorussus aquaticus]